MSFILMRLVFQQTLFPHSREGSGNAIKTKKEPYPMLECACVYISPDHGTQQGPVFR